MTQRFLVGYNHYLGMWGVFLTKPGIDLASATLPIHFLLYPTLKNEQVVAAAQVYVAPNTSYTSYFPFTLDIVPFVTVQESVETAIHLPFRSDLEDAMIIHISATTSSVSFYNESAHGVYINYSAVTRRYV